eukprot:CAMPEP_0203889454 /NCGR_PEP_ID=MMETSP0359-20131031/33005_1 /ASSEMBLY_ACC=CAM_ASM_000338 /TAXON_ID=268821 /ORGANISM="Scrippsiella Hangoei, Strain SHTV-5" /LENGTH=319 /DNA_ID=CAMNT_0050810875 /DNA_START=16 /DNA_END=975 /DNA_ORIENTATION=-
MWRYSLVGAGSLSALVVFCLLIFDQPAVDAAHFRQDQPSLDSAFVRREVSCSGQPSRVAFSLTTTAKRIEYIQPVIDAIVTGQTRPPDVVYVSVGPDVKLPSWLETYSAQDSAAGASSSQKLPLVRVLRQDRDPGPGLKLIGAAREELAAGHRDTLIVYGDDDVVYGKDVVNIHVSRAHCQGEGQQVAWGSRLITAGDPKIPVLEATGTISILSGAVPERAFVIGETADACKFSDDFYLAYTFREAGLDLKLLDECKMDWVQGTMSPRCKERDLEEVRHIGALSSVSVDHRGKANRGGGDWRDQLRRYEMCGKMLVGGQ